MSQYFQVTKNSQIFNNMPWFCASMFLYHKTIFCRISKYLWDFLLSQKDQSLIPKFSGSGSSDFSELTVAGRPGRSTGRAQTCTPVCTGERSTVPVDRFRELCSQEISVDRAGRPTESLLSPPGARSTGPVDRRLQRSDFWPLPVDRTGRPEALTEPNGQIFLASIKGGFVIVLSQDFWRP